MTSERHRPPEKLTGARLVVRRYWPTDAPALHRAVTASVEHLRPWMPWIEEEPLEVEDRRHLIAEWDEAWEAGQDHYFGIFDGAELVGACGLHARLGPGALEIGYWTRVDRTGTGVATEAAGCLVAAAFSMPTIHAVEVHHDVANTASGRVPERLGFRHVEDRPEPAEAPAETGVRRIWRLTREEWSEPRGRT